MELINVPIKFEIEVRSFTRSWDNGGYLKNWAVPGSRSLFSKIFNVCFVGMDPVNAPAEFEVWSFTRFRVNTIEVLGGVANPQSGMVPLKRALVSSYRPSIVTFHLSLRVSKILPLLSHPTSSLPQISPCSLGLGGWPLGCEANCPCN